MSEISKGPGALGRPATRVWWVTEDENDDGSGLHIPVWFCHFANDGSDDRCRFDTDPIILLIAPSTDMGDEWLPEGFIAVCARHAVVGIGVVEEAVERANGGALASVEPWPRWTVFVAPDTVEKGLSGSSVMEVRGVIAPTEDVAHDMAAGRALTRLRETCDEVTVTRVWTGEPTPGV